MFFRHKQQTIAYDPGTQRPALRCSICTGEQVAGFVDRRTGRFVEVQLIRTPQQLEEFRTRYGIPPECGMEKIY